LTARMVTCSQRRIATNSLCATTIRRRSSYEGSTRHTRLQCRH
jgi:hypothetical protein